jgi:rhamnose transport system permease protein
MPVMLIALGMTLVVLTGEIDISVGSVFAVCSVVMGVCARTGAHSLSWLAAVLLGLGCGALNGVLVAYLRVPSIVTTLAAMVALRDGLRWATQGAWITGLPSSFQWFGLSQRAYTGIAIALLAVLIAASMFALRYLRIGRAVLATGSNAAAARLVGISTRQVIFWTLAATGALTGLAAALNAVRFNQVPSNTGIGLEMQVIAAVAIGGAVFTGGSGTIAGTVLGVVLLAIIGPALTFLGLSAYWETALQGAIILAAITFSVLVSSSKKDRLSAAAAST